MSLVKCPECGQMVSDKSANCIHCGAPIEKNLSVRNAEQKYPRVPKTALAAVAPLRPSHIRTNLP